MIFLLQNAVNRVIPQDQSFSTNNDMDVQIVNEFTATTPMETATDMLTVGNNVGSHNLTSVINEQPSSSRIRQRLLHFSVHYQDRIVQVEIPDTGTVG